MDDISVPSILASQNLVANSFSMCFTNKGIGRISFGDSGSDYEGQTPFNPTDFNLYNVTITQVSVGENISAESFSAFLDTGTSFTHLSEPAFTLVSEKFDSQVKDKRIQTGPKFPFKHCYQINSIQKDTIIPVITLTMEGGDQFIVQHPALEFDLEDGSRLYCLGVVKFGENDLEKEVMKVNDLNIIGENFLTGYRIVFDREKTVLGWKASDCKYAASPGTHSPTNTTPPYSRQWHGSSDALSIASSHYFLLIVITIVVQIL